MKRLISLVVLFMFAFTTGCASFGGAEVIDPDYAAYTATVQSQLTASQKPLVDIKVDSDGRISAITMNQPPRYIQVEQKRPHPVWKAIETTMRVVAPIGMIWATFDGAAELVSASGGTTTNINSGNDNSKNSGSIASDYTITDTITTDNSTAAK